MLIILTLVKITSQNKRGLEKGRQKETQTLAITETVPKVKEKISASLCCSASSQLLFKKKREEMKIELKKKMNTNCMCLYNIKYHCFVHLIERKIVRQSKTMLRRRYIADLKNLLFFFFH